MKTKTIKSEDFFKVGNNNISWVGINFQEHFWGVEFIIPKKVELKKKILQQSMLDREILDEFKPKESDLGELAYALQNKKILLKNGNANIFYTRDKKNILWAVLCYWSSDFGFWSVGAVSVGGPRGWFGGYQVLSRDFNFDTSDPSESVNLGRYESLENRVKALESKFEDIKKIL